jgi:hypothetical protein
VTACETWWLLHCGWLGIAVLAAFLASWYLLTPRR